MRAYGNSCGYFTHVCVVALETARRTEMCILHKMRVSFFSAVSVPIISHLEKRLASCTYVKIDIGSLIHVGFQN
jgi:hypothetical protein